MGGAVVSAAVLSSVDVLNACRHARRIGETLGERMPNAPAEMLWRTARSVLGLPPELPPEQERQVFDCFEAARRSSATMRAAVPFDADPHGHKVTRVLSPAPVRFAVAQWVDATPAVEEPTPPKAFATFVRSLWRAFTPNHDARALRVKNVATALALEGERHRRRVEEILLGLRS